LGNDEAIRIVSEAVKKLDSKFKKFWDDSKYTEAGADRLEILDKEEKMLYTIDMQETWVDFKKDWGWGLQYFIPRKYFEKTDFKE
jgi:hypothetical protein